MTERTFYIDIDGGKQDTSIVEIRRLAMDWLWTHPNDGSVTIFTSPTKRHIVGMIVLNRRGTSLFTWTSPRGRVQPLFRNGGLYKNLY